ncbi:chemotaxis protein CheW, partial [bacterium]|nr:chemotaxis protein CheW [bacterium]
RTCIVVVNINNIAVGLVVDTVNEVLDISEAQIDPPPRTHSGIKSNYILGMGKFGNQVKILLDIEKILQEEELEKIQQSQ